MSSQPQWRPEAWQLTDQGMSRDHNEDYCDSFDPDDPAVLAQRGRLWLVADGIGGHQAGDVASKYAVEKVLYAYYEEPWVEPAHNLVQAIQDANADLYEEAQRNPAHRGMGTTMVAAVLLGDGLIVANVGDSRAYLFRDGDPRQITRDHSWVAEQVERGVLTPQQARAHPERNVITRSLGNDPHVRVDVFRETLRSGDVVVLCSDGLSGVVLDGEIAGMVEGAHARTASERLVRLANERGGPDNVTVTVIRMATHVPSPTPVRIPSKEESTPV
ncbi:MAG TPA: Stp1/IreP family PP2C-type Ser/Thr phosphatase, partial [Anaerolineae bacterium]|nr:Stp1/IreP family PP2C-type Ser/Thr phosphatase [Anaerolineae bacterium]